MVGCLNKVRMFVQQGLVPRPQMLQPSEEMCTLTSANSPGIGHAVWRLLQMIEDRSKQQYWEQSPTGSSPLPEECSFPYCVGAQKICCVSVLLKCTRVTSRSHYSVLNCRSWQLLDRFNTAFWKNNPEILKLLSKELDLSEVFLLQHNIPQAGVSKNE